MARRFVYVTLVMYDDMKWHILTLIRSAAGNERRDQIGNGRSSGGIEGFGMDMEYASIGDCH